MEKQTPPMDHTFSTCSLHQKIEEKNANKQKQQTFKHDFHSCPFRNEYKPFCMTFFLLPLFV